MNRTEREVLAIMATGMMFGGMGVWVLTCLLAVGAHICWPSDDQGLQGIVAGGMACMIVVVLGLLGFIWWGRPIDPQRADFEEGTG